MTVVAFKAGDTLYDLEARDIDGNVVKLDKFKDQVLLIVNVASACSTTPQYRDLQDLYNKYKDKSFNVLAFPCNQFGNEEPGSNQEIKEFATSKFGVTFPLMSKIEVNGPNTHPIYEWLKEQKGGPMPFDAIKWNFTKFLVDKSGNVINRYLPTTNPHDIEADIVKLIS
jgi:glutathione peroxidase